MCKRLKTDIEFSASFQIPFHCKNNDYVEGPLADLESCQSPSHIYLRSKESPFYPFLHNLGIFMHEVSRTLSKAFIKTLAL